MDCDFAEAADDGLAFWGADCDPMVLEAEAHPATACDPEILDLFALPVSAAILDDGEVEHVLIADGLRHLRLAVRGVSILRGPVRLSFAVPSLQHIPPKVLLLRRLSALWRLHRLPRPLFPADPVVARWVRALQALDARQAGAGQREIVVAVLGPKMADARSFDSSRKKVARMLALAEHRVEVSFRRFLSDSAWDWEG